MWCFYKLTKVSKWTLILFLIIGTFRIYGQDNRYRFEYLNTKNGLSNNQINAIYKDDKGFMWFGTMSGLNRFDGYNFKIYKSQAGDSSSINDDFIEKLYPGPEQKLWVSTPEGWNIFDLRTDRFIRHPENDLKKMGLPDETFTGIIPDGKNNFWYIFPGKGIYKYDGTVGKSLLYNKDRLNYRLYSNSVTDIGFDHLSCLWIIYADGIIEKRDATGRELLDRSNILQRYTNVRDANYQLFIDADNDLWIYATGDIKSVFYLNTTSDVLLPIGKNSEGIQLNNDIIKGITQDNKGNIWVATDHGGINLINKKTLAVTYLVNDENDNKSISQNSINSIYKDRSGIIWLGTFKKGINFFHESSLRFPLFQHLPSKPNSLLYNDVNRFVEDKKGNLWIGTNGGGLIYFDRTEGTYKQYLHDKTNPNSLSNNVIVSLLIDKDEKLWIGTYFGGLDCFDGEKFTNYKHDESNPHSLADDRVWELFEDSRQRLWIGTLNEGVQLLDRQENQFIHFQPNKINSKLVSSFIENNDGNLWIGTNSGIDILDPRTRLFTHFRHVENDDRSLSNNNVIDMLRDSRGLIWIATRDGLNVYNPAEGGYQVFRTTDGLPDNIILTILEDDYHNLWVSTPNGLSNVIIKKTSNGRITIACKNYDEADGLQGRQFNENAALKTRKGELVFGGADGFNIFMPAGVEMDYIVPPVVLTGLKVFNNSIKTGEKYGGRIVLQSAISEAREITLKHSQNVFTVEFAALEFINPDKIEYAYQLKGFNEEWLTANSKDRKAGFTNLNPGTYTLLIKAGNEAGDWSEEPLAVTIHVLPPFWLTPMAWLIYFLMAVSILFYSRKRVIKKAGRKFQLAQEKIEAQRLHELDTMKIRFFTNLSHEFRTPISLIMGPTEKLLKQIPEVGVGRQLQLINRNARRLLNMVNQLLDFRKLEENEIHLNKTVGDIVPFVYEVYQSFIDFAENKNISFQYHATCDHLFTSYDAGKIERILFNLLSNAFKFTPSGGSVSLSLEVLEGEAVQKGRTLQIKVADTGIGIEKDKQEKIFQRFFQNDVPRSILNQGSGIGLSITREFVRLHGGTIRVESDVNEGSCFFIMLPVPEPKERIMRSVQIDGKQKNAGKIIREADTIPETDALKTSKDKREVVLLVEDNEDFRFYLKDNLKSEYYIIEADNGKTGWQKTLSEHPGLIVSDVSMPEMNGIDLCRKIKSDERTHFIPVILLTALTGEEQQLAGLQTGANDYITKPFSFEILNSKIKNLLLQQDSFKRAYQKQVQLQASEIIIESADDKFIHRALSVIEKNIPNADFSVEKLSREMLMSRVALYKKIFGLTGKTPLELIQSIRLQRAVQFLEKHEMTIAEIAYEVGFNNPKYFSKCFKQVYNASPSSYMEKMKK